MSKYLFNERIFLVKINPNFYGRKGYYELNEIGISKCESNEIQENINFLRGYYFEFFNWKLKKEFLSVFEYDGKIFIHYSDVFCEIKSEFITIKGFPFWKKVIVNNFNSIEIFIPPYEYLSNDGMFPDMVSPAYSFFKDIKEDYHQRIGILMNLKNIKIV